MSNLACITYLIVNAWDAPVSVNLLFLVSSDVSLIALLRVFFSQQMRLLTITIFTVYELEVLLFKVYGKYRGAFKGDLLHLSYLGSPSNPYMLRCRTLQFGLSILSICTRICFQRSVQRESPFLEADLDRLFCKL